MISVEIETLRTRDQGVRECPHFANFLYRAFGFVSRYARKRLSLRNNSLVKSGQMCYVCAAFVALVTPLESIEGAAGILAASFALRLEAVEK
jgi:hypothetical protein